MAINMVRKEAAEVNPAPNAHPDSLRLLSIRQAAVYAVASQSTIRRLISTGLKTYRVRRQIRINEADLIAFISEPK